MEQVTFLEYAAQTPNTIMVSGQLWDTFKSKKISANELVLAMVFIDMIQNRDIKSETVNTTNKKLVEASGFSQRSIETYIKNLEEAKVIFIERDCKTYTKEKDKMYWRTRIIKLNMYVK